MKVVILAGGRGSRLFEETGIKPKPMVEIGGRPILWHIMKYFSVYGFNEFVLALGYKSEVIRDYFVHFYEYENDVQVNLSYGNSIIENLTQNFTPYPWKISLINTGLTSQTGGRIKRLQKIIGNQPFLCTYGDGLANVNLSELLDFHGKHGKVATVTAVAPPPRFGKLSLDRFKVIDFSEKIQLFSVHNAINGGFFVFNPEIFDYLPDDNTVLETDPMFKLVKEEQLMAYPHDGFFRPMDTMRDKDELEELWRNGKAPWKIW